MHDPYKEQREALPAVTPENLALWRDEWREDAGLASNGWANVAAALMEFVADSEQRGRVAGARQVSAAVEEAAPPVNFGMHYNGTVDRAAEAYVEGHHDAWAAAREALTRIEQDGE